MPPELALRYARTRRPGGWLLGAALLALSLPVLLIAGVSGVISQRACEGEAIAPDVAAGGQLAQGLYAAPLQLRPGRWYEVGATTYGGPGDPGAGSYGSIPLAGQAYLPAHPDSFAELSVLRGNPANGAGSFSFADANALANLPYLTALRVAHGAHAAVLYKRDIGYGQGPGPAIANGQPYRLDVWWRSARELAISKDAVQVALAPATGSAQTLAALPSSSEAAAGLDAGACQSLRADSALPLTLVPGVRTMILASGLAAAGNQAPEAVRAMVAAGNRLFGTSYLYGGGHGPSLDTRQPAYDCSAAVSYLLHWGGVLGASALDSGGLASYGLPGPGRYVSIYANAAHAFMYVAGLRLDTVEDGAYDSGPNAGRPGARWRVSASVPAWSRWSVRHPAGL